MDKIKTTAEVLNFMPATKQYLLNNSFKVSCGTEIPFHSIGLNLAWKFGNLEFGKQRTVHDGKMDAPTEKEKINDFN